MEQPYIDFVIKYKNGKKEITIVNSPGVSCGDLPADDIARKLMGEDVEITDIEHTEQYYDEKAGKTQSQQEEVVGSFIKRRPVKQSEPRQKIDQ